VENAAGSPKPKKEPKPSRLKTLLRTLVQIWLLDRWVMSPIREFSERKEPFIVFGAPPKKKKPAKRPAPRTWWQRLWSDPPAMDKEKNEESGSGLLAVSAFLAGAAFIWLLGKTRRPGAGRSVVPAGSDTSLVDHVTYPKEVRERWQKESADGAERA
jgi:hypothetical protein